MKTNTIEYEYSDSLVGRFILPDAMTIVLGDSRTRYVPETVEVVIEPPKPPFAVGDIVEVVKPIGGPKRGTYGLVVLSIYHGDLVVEFGVEVRVPAPKTQWNFVSSYAADSLRLVKAATS